MDSIFHSLAESIIMQECPDEETFISERAGITADFVLGEMSRLANKHKIAIHESKLTPELAALIVSFFHAKLITSATAKALIARIWDSGEHPVEIIAKEELWRISDEYEIISIVATLCVTHEKKLQEYSEGNEKVGPMLIGHLMKITKGCADATMLSDTLKKLFFYPEYHKVLTR